MDRVGLIRELAEAALKRPLEACRPLPLSGWQAVEALWPLNDRFRPKLHMIRSIGYDPAHEREADQAIEALLLAQSDWGDVTANAWRVLLERQQQGLAVALLVERSGRPLMSVPEGLSSADRSALAVAFVLHSMRLPWPAEDRAGLELPHGALPASLQRH